MPTFVPAQSAASGNWRAFGPGTPQLAGPIRGLAQDKYGLVFAATPKGLATFNGGLWHTLALPNNRPLLALAVSREGTIYVGSNDEIGYFIRENSRTLRYVSLTTKLPVGSAALTEVRQILMLPEGATFVTEKQILQWDGRQLKVIVAPKNGTITNGFEARNKLVVHVQKEGLFQLTPSGWKSLTPNQPNWNDVYAVFPYGKDRWLVASRTLGIRRWNGTRWTRWNTALNTSEISSSLYIAISLQLDEWVFASTTGILYYIDRRGKAVKLVEKNSPLTVSGCRSLLLDNEKNLWIGTNEGLGYLELRNPLVYYQDNIGLKSEVGAFAIHNGTVYAGSYQGLDQLIWENGRILRERVQGVEGTCNALLSHSNGLYAATDRGVFLVNGLKARQLSERNVNSLYAISSSANDIFLGAESGLYILRKNTGQIKPIENFSVAVRNIVSVNPKEYWVATRTEGLARLRFDADPYQPSINRFDSINGLPSHSNNWVFVYKNQLYASTSRGIYSFNPTKKFFQRVKELNPNYLRGQQLMSLSAQTNSSSKQWALYSNNIVLPFPPPKKRPPNPFQLLRPDEELIAILPTPKRGILGGLERGFVQSIAQPNTRVRSNGYISLYVKAENDSFPAIFAPHLAGKRTLTYDNSRVLEFHFYSLSFIAPERIQYRYRLVERDSAWSAPVRENSKVYLDLSPGTYTFEVKAINANGDASQIASIEVEIRPPWYSSTFAFLLYVILGGLFIYSIIRWRLSQAERERQVLEQKVEERTQEVMLQKGVLEEAFREISVQNEKMAKANEEINRQNSELNARSDELQRTLDELTSAQSQLIMSEKMAVLGQVVAGVAHEINTPIGVINASGDQIANSINPIVERLPGILQRVPEEHHGLFWELIQLAKTGNHNFSTRELRQIRKDQTTQLESMGFEDARGLSKELQKINPTLEASHYEPILRAENRDEILELVVSVARIFFHLNHINSSVQKTKKIINALKSYSYKHAINELVKIDLVKNVEDVVMIYENTLKSYNTSFYSERDPILAWCYPDELSQVWTNIISNAAYAMGGRGEFRTTIQAVDDWAFISFTDTGPGVPEEIQDKIFEAFFTTKPQGEGTGIGLDISTKIVKKHNGEIRLDSRPGLTTFTIVLPIGGPESVSSAPPPSPALPNVLSA